MLRIIIIYIAIVVCTNKTFSQQANADSLLFWERKIYMSHNDTEIVRYRLNKFTLYINSNDCSAPALNEAQHIDYTFIKNSIQQKIFLWNAAIVADLNSESNYAKFYFTNYEKISGDSSKSTLILGLLINKNDDTVEVRRRVADLEKKDTAFKCLSCMNKVAAYKRKHKARYIVSSFILPGSGTAFNGQVVKGIVSLCLTAASVYGVYQMVQNSLYINAVLWGAGPGIKFYGGNIRLTSKEFDKKELRKKNKLAVDCELKLNALLNKTPIEFK